MNVDTGARRSFLTLLLLLLFLISYASGGRASEDECTRTARMQIYSAASVSQETGDLDGYELAFEQHKDSSVDALLYIYEGQANDGIPISGRLSGQNLTLQGTWKQHLIEYPSKKEIVVSHFVRIEGTLDPSGFRGILKIEGLDTPASLRLKRVNQIWICKH